MSRNDYDTHDMEHGMVLSRHGKNMDSEVVPTHRYRLVDRFMGQVDRLLAQKGSKRLKNAIGNQFLIKWVFSIILKIGSLKGIQKTNSFKKF